MFGLCGKKNGHCREVAVGEVAACGRSTAPLNNCNIEHS